jgi:hypothetical protein
MVYLYFPGHVYSIKKIAKEIDIRNSEADSTGRKEVSPMETFSEVANRLMSYNAHVHAPEVTAPLTDELTGSLRSIKVSIPPKF